MKYKIKNKFSEYHEKKGTIQTEPTKTDISQIEDSDIYCCLRKYGITSLINQSVAKEHLYLDNTNRNLTLDEALRQRKQLEEYFLNMPARARKVFGDNVETFIHKYKEGQFDEFLSTGAMSQDMINTLKKAEQEEKNAYREQLKEQIRQELQIKNELTQPEIQGGLTNE